MPLHEKTQPLVSVFYSATKKGLKIINQKEKVYFRTPRQ